MSESTSFAIPSGSRVLTRPYDGGDAIFAPSAGGYEMPPLILPLGEAIDRTGFAFPTLFEIEKGARYAMVTEADLDRSYCATRLHEMPDGGRYQIRFPDEREGRGFGDVLPESPLPFNTPWRVIAIGKLATIVESTIVDDLSAPSVAWRYQLDRARARGLVLVQPRDRDPGASVGVHRFRSRIWLGLRPHRCEVGSVGERRASGSKPDRRSGCRRREAPALVQLRGPTHGLAGGDTAESNARSRQTRRNGEDLRLGHRWHQGRLLQQRQTRSHQPVHRHPRRRRGLRASGQFPRVDGSARLAADLSASDHR